MLINQHSAAPNSLQDLIHGTNNETVCYTFSILCLTKVVWNNAVRKFLMQWKKCVRAFIASSIVWEEMQIFRIMSVHHYISGYINHYLECYRSVLSCIYIKYMDMGYCIERRKLQYANLFYARQTSQLVLKI